MIAAVIDRLFHGLFYAHWTPDWAQSWWYEHVCRPAAEWEMPS